MSSFSLVVVTGSKVIVDGMFDAPANVTCWLLTGAQPVPVQQETVTAPGSSSLASTMNEACSDPTCFAGAQAALTQSSGRALVTPFSVCVATLGYRFDQEGDGSRSSIAAGSVVLTPKSEP